MYDVIFTRPARVLGLMMLTLMLGAAGGAHAGTEAFTQERFEALQAAGALVLVDVHADWCPTCAKQQKVLDAYEAARSRMVRDQLTAPGRDIPLPHGSLTLRFTSVEEHPVQAP